MYFDFFLTHLLNSQLQKLAFGFSTVCRVLELMTQLTADRVLHRQMNELE